MAKWGEGDPRWIVEERPDATNVNNWHWSEKNANTWSEAKLKNLLVGLKFDGPEGSAECTEVEKTEGEAIAHNRKGKLIFFYEWSIQLKWQGNVLDSGANVAGDISIPNFSEEHEMEEVDVIVTAKTHSDDAEKMKAMMHRISPAVVRDRLSAYLKLLKEEFSQGLILPCNTSASPAPSSLPPAPKAAAQRGSSPASRRSGSGVGCRIHTTKLTLSDSFMTSTDELYNTLTTQELVEAFTRSKSVVDARRGGQFSLLGGKISGEFVELNRPNRIVQRWREQSWPEGHYSMVTLSLQQETDCSKLCLTQTEVPEADADRTADGWKTYIFQGIKRTFGFGASLM